MSGVSGDGVPAVLRRLMERDPCRQGRGRRSMSLELATAKLLVVKIGSALVVDGSAPRAAWLDGVAADVAAAKARGTARHPRLLRRHRAGPPHAGVHPGPACGWRRSRPPPPSAKSASPRPGPPPSPPTG